MKLINQLLILISIATIFCITKDGYQESICWYLFYGSLSTSVAMITAFTLMLTMLVVEGLDQENVLYICAGACMLGIIATMNYLDNPVAFTAHDIFSYGMLIFICIIIDYKSIILLALCVGLFEYLGVANLTQELIAIALLTGYNNIKHGLL